RYRDMPMDSRVVFGWDYPDKHFRGPDGVLAMKIPAPRRRGTVAIMVAVTLVLLISFLAIALDGGLLLHNRRVAPAAAPAAALAAADSLYLNYQTGAGSDVGNQAQNAALAVAAANGFGNDRSSTSVDVYIPPQSGFAANKAGYAEVVVKYNQPRGFSNILGTGPLPVTARA